jgi:hypothetical protein
VAYLKVLSRNSPRGYEENHEIEVEVPARMWQITPEHTLEAWPPQPNSSVWLLRYDEHNCMLQDMKADAVFKFQVCLKNTETG